MLLTTARARILRGPWSRRSGAAAGRAKPSVDRSGGFRAELGRGRAHALPSREHGAPRPARTVVLIGELAGRRHALSRLAQFALALLGEHYREGRIEHASKS